MFTALELIAVALAVVTSSTALPTVSGSNTILDIGPTSYNRALQDLAKRYDYTYTPGVGAHKIHRQATTWDTARRTCNEEYGHLAIINSVAESEVIGRLLTKSMPHNGSQNSQLAHIGIHELYGQDDWVTIHGESVADMGFNIWQDGEPDDEGDVEHCGCVFTSGKAVDVRCHSLLGFVCELPDVSISSQSVGDGDVVHTVQPLTKRDDYTYTPKIGVHKVHTRAATWNSARKICMGEGGQLAVINSPAESEVVVGLVANSGNHVGSADSNSVYLGFHDLYHEGQFVTINGESFETVGFNEWVNGEPNNGDGAQEDCGTMYKNGKLNDVGCETLLGFVCELASNIVRDSITDV